jgi:hypothetical protein
MQPRRAFLNRFPPVVVDDHLAVVVIGGDRQGFADLAPHFRFGLSLDSQLDGPHAQRQEATHPTNIVHHGIKSMDSMGLHRVRP